MSDPATPNSPEGRARLAVPRTPGGEAALDALCTDPAGAVIASDFDGTLSPIVADPSAARPYPGTVDVLRRLARRVAVVAIVTGRPAQTLIDVSGFAGLPIVVMGLYGFERWEAGKLTGAEPPTGVSLARAELPELLRDLPPGVVIEDKSLSLAVHTRRASDPVEALERARGPLMGLAARAGLVLEPGRFVLELRPPGMDKGTALREVVRESGGRSVLYAGDDLGDLAAYDAVESLRASGVPGLTVCAGSTEVAALARRADVVVDGPAGVIDFFSALADAIAE